MANHNRTGEAFAAYRRKRNKAKKLRAEKKANGGNVPGGGGKGKGK